MALSTDINRTIKTAEDITYTNNLKLGNITVSPNIGNVLASAHLGSIPLTTASSSFNHLYLQVDKMYLPQNDSTGSHVFINGNSVTTGSTLDNQQIGISHKYSTSATHNVILLHGSVRGAWIYTDNGNIPVYDRKSNNLSLNINETADNKKLYIGFTFDDSPSGEKITYTGSAGTFTLGGVSDEFVIYENNKDIESSRDRMSFTLKMFKEYSKNSGGSGSGTTIWVTLSGVATGSNHPKGKGSQGTEFHMVILGGHKNQVGITFFSSPKTGETFTISSNIQDDGSPGVNRISINPNPFKATDNITVTVS